MFQDSSSAERALNNSDVSIQFLYFKALILVGWHLETQLTLSYHPFSFIFDCHLSTNCSRGTPELDRIFFNKPFFITTLHGRNRKHHLQQLLCGYRSVAYKMVLLYMCACSFPREKPLPSRFLAKN
jgi:hypothetical protein